MYRSKKPEESQTDRDQEVGWRSGKGWQMMVVQKVSLRAKKMQRGPTSELGSPRLGPGYFEELPCLRSRAAAPRNTFVPPPPARVVAAKPLQKPVTLYLELTGNTAAFRTADLVARVQGYLESIDYQDGAAVTKGTQLFGIERAIYQAQLDQTKKREVAHDQAVLAERRRSI